MTHDDLDFLAKLYAKRLLPDKFKQGAFVFSLCSAYLLSLFPSLKKDYIARRVLPYLSFHQTFDT